MLLPINILVFVNFNRDYSFQDCGTNFHHLILYRFDVEISPDFLYYMLELSIVCPVKPKIICLVCFIPGITCYSHLNYLNMFYFFCVNDYIDSICSIFYVTTKLIWSVTMNACSDESLWFLLPAFLVPTDVECAHYIPVYITAYSTGVSGALSLIF